MTHEEWMVKLKHQYDRYDMGFRSAHWETIKDKDCYEDVIDKSDIYIFYVLAIRD